MSTIESPVAVAIETPRDSDAILELLSNPRSYPEPTSKIERVETHISWVFLTDRFVYKLKKPVKYDFLDFSTQDLRRHWCEEEVRINRRLAPGVYAGVVPITSQRRGTLRLGGKGPVVDWVVKMHRLPADQSLDHLLLNNKLDKASVDQLAQVLAAFYQQLPPITLRTDDYRLRIEKHVQANQLELFERATREADPECRTGPPDISHKLDLSPFSLTLVKRIHAAQLRLLRLAPDMLDDRVRDGRIVEGHGDLRPEHIYLNGLPKIIDCIEFNEEYRQIDVLDELGFLAMECDHFDCDEVGQRIIERYQQTSGDWPPEVLLDFYKSYRAAVRAKVLSLRSAQVPVTDQQNLLDIADRYLLLADRYGSRMGAPLLLIVRGLPGTGKSTLASELAGSLGIELLQTDRLRQTIFGPSSGPVGYGEERYRVEAREEVYDEMFRRAAALLDAGLSVVADGAFLSADRRAEAVALARHHEAEPMMIHCICPDNVAIDRIAHRLDRGAGLSEARPEFFQLQKQSDEPDSAHFPVVDVDTTESLPAIKNAVFTRLRDVALASN